MRFVTANMNKDLAGDRPYHKYLTSLIPNRGLLMLQEVGHGLQSTVIEPVGGVKIEHLSTWVIGKVGVHRGVARAKVRFGKRFRWKLRAFNGHGLHVGTSGREAQDRYFKLFARRTRLLNALGIDWVASFDGNRSLESIAKQLGGTAYGKGIIGFVVSPGLRVVRAGVDDTAMRGNKNERWSDHPAYWIDVVKRTKKKPSP